MPAVEITGELSGRALKRAETRVTSEEMAARLGPIASPFISINATEYP